MTTFLLGSEFHILLHDYVKEVLNSLCTSEKKKNLAKTFQNLGTFCGTNSTKPGHLGPIEDLS